MSLATNVTNLATRIATEIKALRTLINGNAANLNALTTTNKANLVEAINEVAGSVGEAGASINDTTTSTLSVWSSSKTDSEINTAVADLINSSPATLDTLDEIAAALGDDPNFATSMATSLGNRVRYDAVQSKTAPETAQARANIGLGNVDNTSDLNKPVSTATQTALNLKEDKTNIGDPNTNYVTTFEAGLL